jgi:hypothetical protein
VFLLTGIGTTLIVVPIGPILALVVGAGTKVIVKTMVGGTITRGDGTGGRDITQGVGAGVTLGAGRGEGGRGAILGAGGRGVSLGAGERENVAEVIPEVGKEEGERYVAGAALEMERGRGGKGTVPLEVGRVGEERSMAEVTPEAATREVTVTVTQTEGIETIEAGATPVVARGIVIAEVTARWIEHSRGNPILVQSRVAVLIQLLQRGSVPDIIPRRVPILIPRAGAHRLF